MTEPRDIAVETYDGYTAPEKPRKVLMSGKEYPVEEILETSRVRRADETGDEEHFQVVLRDYGEAKIIYHHSWDGWTLQERPSAKSFSDEFVESRK